jgi:hypothetical protein
MMGRRAILLAAAALVTFGLGLSLKLDRGPGSAAVNVGFMGWIAETVAVAPAQAVVGRPLTPVSVAGVARRTTRRVVRRSTIYVAALPVGCSTVVINGIGYHQCGATYYQPYQGQYVVVYVD